MSNQRDKIEGEHLSYSQLSEFAGCPRKYFLKRIKKIPAKPAYDLVSGKAVHSGLEHHNLSVVQGHATPLREIIEIGAEHIKACPEGDDLEIPRGRAVDMFVRETTKTVGTYLEKVEPEILKDDIVGIEEEVRFQLGGMDFLGFVDLRTTGGIIDYKLVSRRKSEKEVKVDPQLILYRRHFGLSSGGLALLLREKAVSELVIQQSDPNIEAGVIDWAESIVEAIKTAKATNVWPRADPRAWQCGPTCPYFYQCWRKNPDEH